MFSSLHYIEQIILKKISAGSILTFFHFEYMAVIGSQIELGHFS